MGRLIDLAPALGRVERKKEMANEKQRIKMRRKLCSAGIR
jgi:hypothetical protein